MQPIISPDVDVVVLGSALVELTPKQPGQPIKDADTFIPLAAGSAANFAVALAALGVNVAFMSRVGQDELGQWLVNRLSEQGINTSLIRSVPGHLTPISFCWADRSGQKTFYFYRAPRFSDPMSTLAAGTFEEAEILCGKVFDFTEAAIRAQPLRGAALQAAAIARQAGHTVCYALNYRPDSWSEPLGAIREIQKQAIAAADLVLMNEQEARLIFQVDDTSEALAEAQALGPAVVLITSGERRTLAGFNGDRARIPSYSVTVRYDVGAGDAFHAGFMAAYLRGLPVPQAARWAAAAAALKISQLASAPPPTCQQVEEFMCQTKPRDL